MKPIFAAALSALLPLASPVLAQNEYIIGPLCVGTKCIPENPIYSGVTLMLHEAAPRLRLHDSRTRLTADIRTDWQVEANSSGTNGGDYLAFYNVSDGTYPLVIRDGAPSQAVNIAGPGLGLGTHLPQVSLHIVNDLPRVRLEPSVPASDSETWEFYVAGGDFTLANRTETASPLSRVPIVVEELAPSHALRIKSSGNVGLGTMYASEPLHIFRDDNTAALLIEDVAPGTLGQLRLKNNGTTFLTLEDSSIRDLDNSGRKWNFQNQAGTFRVTTRPGGPGEIELMLTPQGDLTIEGQLYTGGACAAGCDAVFDDGYPLPSIADHHALTMQHRHLPAVGPTPETGPFNLTSMTTGMLNELETAHLYIAQLERQVRLIPVLMQQMVRMQARLDAVEARAK